MQADSLPTEPLGNAGDPGSIPGLGRSTGEGIDHPLQYSWAFLVAQMVKNLPAMWETWILPLDWEDPLEEGMATHSGVLAWRIPRTEEQDRLQSMEMQKVGHNLATNFHVFTPALQVDSLPAELPGKQPLSQVLNSTILA